MANPYEDPAMVAAYALFHYGDAAITLGALPGPAEAVDFPRRSVHELLDLGRLPSSARALDLGCAVGGSAFELSRVCPSVVGIDYSAAFIHAAEQIRTTGRLAVEIPESGDETQDWIAHRPTAAHPDRVEFRTGDAQALPTDLGTFDVLLAANLLCRLPEPQRLLERLPTLIPAGGQLLLTTPFTWLESYTPRANWIRGAAALTEILAPHFELDSQIELPFLLREHARKFQYGIAWGTRWIRR